LKDAKEAIEGLMGVDSWGKEPPMQLLEPGQFVNVAGKLALLDKYFDVKVRTMSKADWAAYMITKTHQRMLAKDASNNRENSCY
jgi:hypothetical protein